MSKRRIEEITCPNCSKKLSVTIWESLNAQLNPEENKQFMNGSLFRVKCGCGFSTTVDYTMLYNNMTKNVMVYYVPEDNVEEIKKMFVDTQKQIDFADMKDYQYRVVTSQNSLREKAVIFDLGLDDHVIEIIKLFYYARMKEEHPDFKIEDILFFVSNDEWFLQFVGSTPATVVIKREFYENTYVTFKDRLTKADLDEMCVDFKWAVDFYNK